MIRAHASPRARIPDDDTPRTEIHSLSPYVALASAELVSNRSTRFHPAGRVIALPAVCTIIWATITSPLVVPAGRLMVSVEPPAPLLPVAAARSEIPPPGGAGVGVGGDVGVGVGVGVAAPAGSSAISTVILELAPPLCVP